jgi:hypothetical protein
MKHIFLLVCILFSFGFTYQSKNDPKLIGTWKGSEKNNQIDGVKKSWIMIRKSNGSYKIKFSTKDEEGNSQTFEEKGKWWTSGNQLFEQYEGSDKPAVYTYKILDDKTIYFKMTTADTEFNNSNYEFIDTKIE